MAVNEKRYNAYVSYEIEPKPLDHPNNSSCVHLKKNDAPISYVWSAVIVGALSE